MSVTGQAGVFAYGIQSAKGTLASTWYRHKAMDISFGAQQDAKTFPLEVGGIITPTGSYKGMVYGGGGVTINPRLNNQYGWLLKGALGSVTTGTDAIHNENIISAAASGADAADGGLYLPNGSELSKTSITAVIPSNAKRPVVIVRSAQATALTGTLTVTDGTNSNTFDLTAVTGLGTFILYDATPANLTTGSVSTLAITTSGLASSATTGKVKIFVGLLYDTAAGVKEHNFRFNPSDSADLPWMSVRTVTPGSAASDYMGLEIKDTRVTNMRLQMPQNGLVSSRIDFLGREPRVLADPYNNAGENWDAGFSAYDDYQSVPISCVIQGGLHIPGYTADKVPLTQATFTLANNLSSPQQEMTIGSYYPDDFTPLSRAATIQATVKWKDPSLYRLILQNSLTGSAWSPVVFNSPFEAQMFSPGNISTTLASQWHMRLYAPSVMWTADQAPTLAGGELVMFTLQGQVLDPGAGDYISLKLTNNTASY